MLSQSCAMHTDSGLLTRRTGQRALERHDRLLLRNQRVCRGLSTASSYIRHAGTRVEAQVSRRQFLNSSGALGAALLLGHKADASTGTEESGLSFESRVNEFTLSNGLHFIVLERHNAPVVSCHTHARVGAFVEDEGSTGLAHLLEHMAFKGTARIGSRDWRAEQQVLQAQDEVFYELRELKNTAAASGNSTSRTARIQQLREQLTKLKADGEELLVSNAFGSMLQEAGAVGLNAATSHDNTKYYVLLPTNKLELWFALESERFQAPVLRELYTEKEVIVEERRARYENSPIGRFTGDYLLQALDNPYRRPVIGFADDFAQFGSHEVAGFFNKYYHPRNLTISIVGDVDPADVQQLAEKYFGSWRPSVGAITLTDNLQQLAMERLPQPVSVAVAPYVSSSGGRILTAASYASFKTDDNSSAVLRGFSGDEFVQKSAAGPLLTMGYYRPSIIGRTGTALEVASDILSGGRSSCLIKHLVQKGVCLSASCLPGYPGELHPGLALVSAVPRPDGDMNQLSDVLQSHLDELANEGPSAVELARVKASARVALLGALTSNSSMAGLLSSYHAVTGSWRGVLEELDYVETMTGAEVSDIVQRVFRPENRFIGKALPLDA